MKKLFFSCLILMFAAFPVFASIYDDLSESDKALAQGELNFYSKLKSCTPASHTGQKLSLKIIGVTNGMCNWQMSIGSGGFMDFKCSAPISATAQFASLKLEYLKDMYGLNSNTSFDSFDKIMSSDYTQKYCK